MNLPEDVKSVIERLETAGYEAWAVGGCVRDSILNRHPKDFDISSSCPPAIVCTLFPRCYKTGLAYGTVTVLTQSMPIEVTVFRRESEYADSRHPNVVTQASDIKTDLSRRDFTMNAIAWHPSRGICDPFQGQTDIGKKSVRAVGDPFLRFSEDALRILRCVRFASELNFDIDSSTLEAARQLAPALSNISVERINSELRKLLTGSRPELAEEIIRNGGLKHCGLNRLKNALLLRKIPSFVSLRLAGLLWLGLDPVSETRIQETMRILRTDNQTTKEVCRFIAALGSPLPSDPVSMKRAYGILPSDQWAGYLALRSALFHEDTQPVTRLLEETKGQPWNRAMLAVTGNDIRSIGIKDRQVGTVLNALLEEVLRQPSLNHKSTLMELAQAYGDSD